MSVSLVSSLPNSSAANPDANLVLTFSASVVAGSGMLQIRNAQNMLVFEVASTSDRVTISGATVTIDPPADLAFGQRFYVSVPYGWVADVMGGKATGSSFSFSTEQSGAPLNLSGTDGADYLVGSAFADTLEGRGGDDLMYGNAGNDSLRGGDGKDNMLGQDGNDWLDGGAGNDRLDGGNGNDTLDGGSGDDELIDDGGDNSFAGGLGNDSIYVNGSGAFIADGGDGNDYLTGGAGNGRLMGGAGDDSINMTGISFAMHTVEAVGGTGRDTISFNFGYAASVQATASGGEDADIFVLEQPESGSWKYVISDFSIADGDQLDISKLLPYGLSGNPFGSSGYARLEQVGNDTVLWMDRDGTGARNTMVATVTLLNVAKSSLTGANFVNGYTPDGGTKGITVSGTAGDDNLKGTALDDLINGGTGNDKLYGGNGNDVLNGGDESSGGDELHGEYGDDSLGGGAGADKLYGEDGNDKLYGGSGADTLDGGNGDDLLDGGAGDDNLLGSAGNDTLLGGDGNDNLIAMYGGSKRLEGGAGNDTLRAISGNVSLFGEAGDDQFSFRLESFNNAAAVVAASGGDGNDSFVFESPSYSDGKSHTIELSGGAGRDLYRVSGAESYSVVVKDFAVGAGGDVLEVMGLSYVAMHSNPFGTVGALRLQQSGADTVLQYDMDGAAGSAYGFRDVIRFSNVQATSFTRDNFTRGISPTGESAGMDLSGSSSADILEGDFLDDAVRGLDGDDLLHGQAGNDVLEGGAGNDQLYGDAGDDKLFGGDGDDRLFDSSGMNELDGGAGNDFLECSSTDGATLRGGDGNDTLRGGGKGYTMLGGIGDDLFELGYYGNNANGAAMLVDGGEGNDTFRASGWQTPAGRLIGGDGSDTYVLSAGMVEAAIVVADFATGEGGDRLDLANLLGFYRAGNPFAPGGIVRFQQEGANAVLYWDSDGDGPKQFQAVLTLANVQVGALTGHNIVQSFPPDGSSNAFPVTGTAGADRFDGSVLNDLFHGAEGRDWAQGDAGNDQLYGDDGDDELYGGAGDDIVDGGAGNDIVIGDAGDNILRGGAGDDRMRGGDGNDTVEGNEGNDFINIERYTLANTPAIKVTASGGAGNDTIRVAASLGAGSVAEVSGGAGADTFELISAWGKSTIIVTDFDLASGDLITLNRALIGLDPGYTPTWNPFESRVRFEQSGKDALLSYRENGQEWTWATFQNTDASTLTFQAIAEGYDPRVAKGAVDIVGTERPDRIVAGSLNDKLAGGAGDDYLAGLGGNDYLSGGYGNDRLLGGEGDDLLDGGAGIDTVEVAAGFSQVAITAVAGGFKVQDMAGKQGTDMLSGVERVKFADATIALDVQGGAGDVYRLYQAAFDRKPDAAGVGFWISQADKGASLTTIANGFIASKEFSALYGTSPANADLVSRFYRNVLHREPDAEGQKFWVDVLDRKAATVAEVLAGFANGDENVAEVAKVIGNGFAYQVWVGG